MSFAYEIGLYKRNTCLWENALLLEELITIFINGDTERKSMNWAHGFNNTAGIALQLLVWGQPNIDSSYLKSV